MKEIEFLINRNSTTSQHIKKILIFAFKLILQALKKLAFILALSLFWFTQINAQVGIGTTTPAASAQLDVTSSSKGMLVPRVALTSLTSASPITSPATSLLVYNTATAGTSPSNVTPGYYYWNGTAWVRFGDNTTSPGKFHWNWQQGNPTLNSLGATYVGNASWQTDYIQLTPANQNQNGKVYWSQAIDWSQPLHISAQFYAGGGTGADINWLFIGCNNTMIGSSATQGTNGGGLSISYDELNERVVVYKSGSQIASINVLSTLDNSKWQVHEIYFGKNADGTRFLDLKTNNGEYLGTVELGSFTASGDYFGAGGWTGASTNIHGIRRLLIESAVGMPR